MTYGPQTPFLEPDNFLFGQYYPDEVKNQSHINDPVVADMLSRQRRTFDVAKRREMIHDIQRHLAKQQYYVQMASSVYVAVWESALKNYGPTSATTTAAASPPPGSTAEWGQAFIVHRFDFPELAPRRARRSSDGPGAAVGSLQGSEMERRAMKA